MQRSGAGMAGIIDAGSDRRFDVFAAPSPGISLPFAPGRNHRSAPASSKTTFIFKSFGWKRRLFCNLNVSLRNQFRTQLPEDIADRPANTKWGGSFRTAFPAPGAITRSRPPHL